MILEGEYKEENGILYRHGAGKYTCNQSLGVYTGNWEMDVMSGQGMTSPVILKKSTY